MNGAAITTHPLSLGGSISLLLAFEVLSLMSFFISAWAWGRMVRREPEGTLLGASTLFGVAFGAFTLAPAGIMTWYVCGGNLQDLSVGTVGQYLLMTAVSPILVYYIAFRFSSIPFIRIIAHGVFTTCICEAFRLFVSRNGDPGPLAPELYVLQWMGLLLVFNSWETHGWAFVERVNAANGLKAWVQEFTGKHRSQFLRMLLLWHFYLVTGEVVVLNYGLGFVQNVSEVAPVFNLYAQWVADTGTLQSAAVSLTAMTAVMLSVFVETMSHTRATRDTALTEQGALEANLRLTNTRYAAVLKNAPYAVFQFDHNLHVDVENTQATLLFGALLPYRDPAEGTLPLPDHFLRVCQTALSGKRTFIEGELPVAYHDQTRWYRLICEPVIGESGNCMAAVAVLDDQTERNQRETELKQVTADAEFARAAAQAASTAKSRFLANMSHEIRTPMNGIYSSIQLLRDPRLMEDKRARVLETMKRSADSMIKLLNDILDLSKVEAGAMKLNPTPIDLSQLGTGVLNLFQAAAEGKQLELHLRCDVPPDFSVVMADELRLQQMLSNLAGNAIKFTQRGSVTLQITASEYSPQNDSALIRFSVIDTGAGIPADELRTVFNAYHQLENQTSGTSDGSAPKGTGLGLTIVKHLAELMAGHVGAQSVPGRGSTFWFEVPLQRAEQVQTQ